MSKAPSIARAVFASNIKRARTNLGYSQEGLAELTKLHRTYIGSVERGERNISVDNMERIATALRQELWKLLQPTSE